MDSKIERKAIAAQKPSSTNSPAKRRRNVNLKEKPLLSKSGTQGFIQLRDTMNLESSSHLETEPRQVEEEDFSDKKVHPLVLDPTQ